MDSTPMNPYWRYPSADGYVAGYRIPRRLDEQLKQLANQSGLSKLHLMEIALRQFVQKSTPLEW